MKRRASSIAIVATIAVVVLFGMTASAFAVGDNIANATPVVPPIPIQVSLTGSMDATYGASAVFQVHLDAGDTLFAGFPDFPMFYLYAYGPTADRRPNLGTGCCDGRHLWRPPLHRQRARDVLRSGIRTAQGCRGTACRAHLVRLGRGCREEDLPEARGPLLGITDPENGAAIRSSSFVVPYDTYCSVEGSITSALGPVPWNR